MGKLKTKALKQNENQIRTKVHSRHDSFIRCRFPTSRIGQEEVGEVPRKLVPSGPMVLVSRRGEGSGRKVVERQWILQQRTRHFVHPRHVEVILPRAWNHGGHSLRDGPDFHFAV